MNGHLRAGQDFNRRNAPFVVVPLPFGVENMGISSDGPGSSCGHCKASRTILCLAESW